MKLGGAGNVVILRLPGVVSIRKLLQASTGMLSAQMCWITMRSVLTSGGNYVSPDLLHNGYVARPDLEIRQSCLQSDLVASVIEDVLITSKAVSFVNQTNRLNIVGAFVVPQALD